MLGFEPGTRGMFQRYFYFAASSPTFQFSPGSFPLLLSLIVNDKNSPNMGSLPPCDDSEKFTSAVSSRQHIFLNGIGIILEKAIKTFLQKQGANPQGPASMSTAHTSQPQPEAQWAAVSRLPRPELISNIITLAWGGGRHLKDILGWVRGMVHTYCAILSVQTHIFSLRMSSGSLHGALFGLLFWGSSEDSCHSC